MGYAWDVVKDPRTINRSIEIRAPREKIWATLTGEETFREWCAAFMPGSHFVGDWSEGSRMRFQAADEQGRVGGMVTEIIEHRPGEVIRSRSVGVLKDGEETFEGEEYDTWVSGDEVYVLEGGPEVFTLSVTNEVPASYLEYFDNAWVQALANIKRLAES